MQFKTSGTKMDQYSDEGLKPKFTDNWGTKNIINP